MTAREIIELRCDAPGCEAAVSTGQRRVGDARAEACGAGGWSTVEVDLGPRQRQRFVRRDYCPGHGPGAPR